MKRGVTFQSLLAHKIAVDFGSSNIVMALADGNIVVDEPSVVALSSSDEVIAIGSDAEAMVGRTPEGITVIRPIVDGAVVDFEVFEFLLRHYFEQIHQQFRVLWQRPEVIVSIESTASDVQKRASIEAAKNAGARSVRLMSKGLAAAIGSLKKDFFSSSCIVLNIGGGTTEVAIVNSGDLLASASIKQAGNDVSEVIVKLCRSKYGLRIGSAIAEKVKRTIGNVIPHDTTRRVKVVGLEGARGTISQASVESDVLTFPLQKSLGPIVALVRDILSGINAEHIEGLSEKGVVISGGGARLKGIAHFIEQKLGSTVRVVRQPRYTTVRGLCQIFAQADQYEVYTES